MARATGVWLVRLLQVRQSQEEEETPMNDDMVDAIDRAISAYILWLFMCCVSIATLEILFNTLAEWLSR